VISTLESLRSPATPPHSEESERALLAAVLLADSNLRQIADRLGAEDFYFERHQLIFRAMVDLAGAGGVDLRTLQARLQQVGQLDQVGGLAYLSGLDVDLPDVGRLDRYVDIVRDCSLRRRLIRLASGLQISCLDGSGVDAADALARAELELRGLAELCLPTTAEPFGQVLGGVIERLEDGDSRSLIGTSTGWSDVDRTILGLRPGNLLILAGGPGAGKTSWAGNVAVHLAAREGIPVGIFSLEMTAQELVLRALCSEADVSRSRLVQGYLSQRQWHQLIGSARRLSAIPILIDDDATLTLPHMLARARRWRAEHGVGLVVIDHLQLMAAGGRWSTRNEELAAISRALKGLAKELEIPILLLSQILMPARQSGDHRPQLTDLRDSRAPAQDADLVMFIHRDELYNPDDPSLRGLAELIVRKNRDGELGTVQMAFFGETFSFRQLAREHFAAPPAGSTAGWQKPPEIFTDHSAPAAEAAEKDPF
jgi:replicative DNA helicase